MNKEYALSVVLNDAGATVKIEGSTGGLLAAWAILTNALSEDTSIPVADLAANLLEAIDTVMGRVAHGLHIAVDAGELRRQQEGHSGTDA